MRGFLLKITACRTVSLNLRWKTFKLSSEWYELQSLVMTFSDRYTVSFNQFFIENISVALNMLKLVFFILSALIPAGLIEVTKPVILSHVLWFHWYSVFWQAAVDVALHAGTVTVGVQVHHTGDHVRGERHDESLEQKESQKAVFETHVSGWIGNIITRSLTSFYIWWKRKNSHW